MKNNAILCLTCICLALGPSARADILELKNGNLLNGKFAGGTADAVRFETSAGQQIIETSRIVALTFTTPPAVAPAPAPVATGRTVTLPYGTTFLVRMMDSVSSHNAAGASFTTKLEYNLVADGVVVAPAGTVIYGKVQSSTQARRAIGRSTLDIRLVQMVVGGSPVPIATSGFQQAGEASIKKIAKAAAVGAIIGNNTGSGDAGEGAAIGAGVSLLKKGQTITIPPGTLLEFTLTQPITVRTAN